jgi:hypothetical protein
MLGDGDIVDIVLRTMPERWLRQFRLSGGTHLTPLNKVIQQMSVYDANDQRQRNNRYT